MELRDGLKQKQNLPLCCARGGGIFVFPLASRISRGNSCNGEMTLSHSGGWFLKGSQRLLIWFLS